MRVVVRDMFSAIAQESDGEARVVDVRENSDEGGDAREHALCLFPRIVSDEVVIGYLLRARKAEQRPTPAPECSGGGGVTLKSELERVANDPSATEERLGVVRHAGWIVRRDIQEDDRLKNAPAPGKPNTYLADLERRVE